MKFEVPQRQQLASERTSLTLFAPAPSSISFVPLTRNLSLADPSPYPVREWTGLSEATATRFSVLRKAREGAAACPGVPENASRTTEGCSAHRISAPYQRRGFPVPNITPVPEKPVFYTECFRKRVAYPRSLFFAPRAYSVPQEALSGTECHKHDAVTSCGADYRVINTIITDIRLMEAAWDKKQPLCGKTSATF